MSITIRDYRRSKRGGMEVDIRLPLPDGTQYRERKKLNLSRTAAKAWAEERRRELINNSFVREQRPAPLLEEFAPRFVSQHAVAEQHKASGVFSKESILRVHLMPAFRGRRLDTISLADVQKLKVGLQAAGRAPKTVNNILTVLKKLLACAVEWGELERVPCRIALVRGSRRAPVYYEPEQYGRFVQEAQGRGIVPHLIALLGGDAGLRCGEMMALEWRDVNWRAGHLVIERARWRGQTVATKGRRVRYVPLTKRLRAVLMRHRRSGGPVLADGHGNHLNINQVRKRLESVAKATGVKHGVHVLRHTFCSRLAASGATTKEIQELAGHQNISTTERYMHLAAGGRERAIRLLDAPVANGEIGEQLS